VDVTIYLPDELGKRAKDEDVKLSRMLRDALIVHFAEEDAMKAAREDADKIELLLQTDEGSDYTGLITGKRIAGNDRVEVFVTVRENVVVYDLDKLKYYVEDGELSLTDLIGDERDVYFEAMDALGREVGAVDLGI
jgi:hypothetical protein